LRKGADFTQKNGASREAAPESTKGGGGWKLNSLSGDYPGVDVAMQERNSRFAAVM
jgi:hypothetical protein